MRNEDREKLSAWLTAAERRYAADLRVQEMTRALRALSASYVERRDRGNGQRIHGALDTAGKRAAFALYYAPLHFIAVAEVVRALDGAASPTRAIADLGCGTGAAGAAWARGSQPAATVTGIDRHPWAVAEARWTYSQLEVAGSSRREDVERWRPSRPGESAIAAYTLNELSDAARERVEEQLVVRARQGGRVLVLEPLARGVAPWWAAMAGRFTALGGRADEWKLPIEVPPLVQQLGTAAGLNYRELRLRTLLL